MSCDAAEIGAPLYHNSLANFVRFQVYGNRKCMVMKQSKTMRRVILSGIIYRILIVSGVARVSAARGGP